MKKTKNKKAQYHAHYLAIIMIVFLLIEAALFSIAGQTDWQEGLNLLDMSSAVGNVQSDMQVVFQPMVDTISDLNLFYQSAATAMTQLLDVSESSYFEPLMVVVDGVNEFYQQAADQMALILDVSPAQPSVPMVAGVSISR